jgi:hypothetical protein
LLYALAVVWKHCRIFYGLSVKKTEDTEGVIRSSESKRMDKKHKMVDKNTTKKTNDLATLTDRR